jgi:hypothetical protein
MHGGQKMKTKRLLNLFLFTIFLVPSLAVAQGTEFTYQGKLNDGTAAANANYDFEFRLYDAGGTQIGSTNSRNGIAVTAGIFSVNLDFGSGFPGADRFLEIGVRPAGGGAFTILSPRQKITSSPYSVKTLAAATADTAASAVNFTGNLAGDVTGTQAATAVTRLQGRNLAATVPVAGQVLKYNGVTNQWEPNTDETGSGGGGTITGVTPGTGLAGGGTSGSVSLSIATGGVGQAQLADGSVTDPKIVTVSGSKVTGAVGNSNQLGGIPASQYAPSAGSSNYIQNTNSPQPTANFNINGNGIVDGTLSGGVVNAVAQYNLNGSRILSNPGSDNLFAGLGAGQANGGSQNSFVGTFAGQNNTSGSSNSFFGRGAGRSNTAGSNNTFVGVGAGSDNVGGNFNSFFGIVAGLRNQTGSDNSFVGNGAGQNNVSGNRNTFVGKTAGLQNTTASDNSFFGADAGQANNGSQNSFVGTFAGQNNTSGSSNSFFGLGAGRSNTTGFNNTFVGTSAGLDNVDGDFNSFFGIVAGQHNQTGSDNSFVGNGAGQNNVGGSRNAFFGRIAGIGNTSGSDNTIIGNAANVGSGSLNFATAIGAGSVATESSSVVLGRSADIVYVPGFLRLSQLGGMGMTALCRNNANTIGGCSSSLRYKTNIDRFGLGLNLVNQLKPITFDWKDGGMHDLGLGAEDVAAIEPLLVTYNQDGQVEGVKYDRIGVVLVNAVKEQQKQIESQNIRADNLQKQIEDLKKLACSKNRRAAVCTGVKK